MRNATHRWHETMLLGLGAVVLSGLLLAAGGAMAQADDPVHQRDRDQDQIQGGAPDQDQLRQQLRDRIEEDQTLGEPERKRLREHLQDCLEADLDAAQVEALFTAPADKGLGSMVQTQERVLQMSRQGLPADLVAEKLREGRMKGAGEAALEGALHRMEENIQNAHQFFRKAQENGVAAHPDEGSERHLTRGVALNLWRGLQEGDLEQLRERARERLRTRECDTTELAAASETACQLQEMGVERQRAVRMAGDALQQGYTAREMRQISWAVMAARLHGGPPEEVMGHLENSLHEGEGMQNMFQHMVRQGWMGDGEGHHGHGAHGPVDDVIGEGPGGPGGPGPGGDDDDHGGHHGDGQGNGQGNG